MIVHSVCNYQNIHSTNKTLPNVSVARIRDRGAFRGKTLWTSGSYHHLWEQFKISFSRMKHFT